jgi:ribosome-binding ATPase YchF (GTP1/OBG family)
MKKNEQLKKEISGLIKNKIYKKYDWRNGFSLNDLKVIAQELFNHRFKIIKIKVKDITGKSHNYKWQDYQKQYTHDWLEEAIEDISELKKAKSYVSVSITKSDFNAIKKVF